MSVSSPLGQSSEKETICLEAQIPNDHEFLAFKSRQAIGMSDHHHHHQLPPFCLGRRYFFWWVYLARREPGLPMTGDEAVYGFLGGWGSLVRRE